MLAVSDSGNHRVKVWVKPITSNNQAPDVIYGQASVTDGSAADSNTIATMGLSTPRGVLLVPRAAGGYALIVADFDHRRIVEWESVTSSNSGTVEFGGNFTRVYGQPDRSSTTANTNGRSMASIACPAQLSHERDLSGNVKFDTFWATDGCYWTTHNSRTLKYSRGNTTATDLFGQPDGSVNSAVNYDIGKNRSSYWWGNYYGRFSCMANDGFFTMAGVTWRTPPANGNTDSDIAASYCYVTSSGTRTWISRGQSIWALDGLDPRNLPVTLPSPAVNLGRKEVDGTTDYTGVADTTEFKLGDSSYLTLSGSKLVALDGNRIVVWDTAGITSHAAIQQVVGQPDKTTNTANQGGISASTLSAPGAMLISGGKLIVTDTGNNRVLIWNTLPWAGASPSDGVPADVVLGQSNSTSSAAGATRSRMNSPRSAVVLNGKFLVADFYNYRILVWNSVPTVTGTPADRAVDMRSLNFSMPGWYNSDALRPAWIGVASNRVYIEQFGRVLVVPDIF